MHKIIVVTSWNFLTVTAAAVVVVVVVGVVDEEDEELPLVVAADDVVVTPCPFEFSWFITFLPFLSRFTLPRPPFCSKIRCRFASLSKLANLYEPPIPSFLGDNNLEIFGKFLGEFFFWNSFDSFLLMVWRILFLGLEFQGK